MEHGTFIGWTGDDVLHSLYRIADLCVVPSIYEPFGLVALEAMASGCPTIVADTGGLREVVPAGQRVGLRFRARDSSSLARMAEKLLDRRRAARPARRAGARARAPVRLGRRRAPDRRGLRRAARRARLTRRDDGARRDGAVHDRVRADDRARADARAAQRDRVRGEPGAVLELARPPRRAPSRRRRTPARRCTAPCEHRALADRRLGADAAACRRAPRAARRRRAPRRAPITSRAPARGAQHHVAADRTPGAERRRAAAGRRASAAAGSGRGGTTASGPTVSTPERIVTGRPAPRADGSGAAARLPTISEYRSTGALWGAAMADDVLQRAGERSEEEEEEAQEEALPRRQAHEGRATASGRSSRSASASRARSRRSPSRPPEYQAPPPAPAPPVPAPPAPPRLKTIQSPIAVYQGAFGSRQAERLAWRAGFGPRPGQAAQLAAMDLEAAVMSFTRPAGPGAARRPGAAQRRQPDQPGDRRGRVRLLARPHGALAPPARRAARARLPRLVGRRAATASARTRRCSTRRTSSAPTASAASAP